MKRLLIAFPILLLALTGLAGAQESTDARLKEMEARIARLEAAQEGTPSHLFQVSGYANVMYMDPEEGNSSFTAQFSPIFLFKGGDKMLFEGELEFAPEEEALEVELEYAQLDYMFSDHAILVAGKFLLPFGSFIERQHPSWINKLPVLPMIYAGHGNGTGAIIPILSDYGVQVRGGLPTGSVRWNYALYVTNGPRANSESGGDSAEEMEHMGSTTVNYGSNNEDDNYNKAVGARVGVLPIPGLEVGLSYYTAEVTYQKFVAEDADPGSTESKPISLTMVDFAYQLLPLDIRGEYLQEDSNQLSDYATSSETDNGVTTTESETIPGTRAGYWLQAAYALGTGWVPEVILRYGSSSSDGEEVANRTTLGFDWWFDPSLVLKVAGAQNTTKVGDSETTTNYYVAMAMGF